MNCIRSTWSRDQCGRVSGVQLWQGDTLLPNTPAVLLERARRIRIAAMRAKHEVAILRSGVQLSGGRTGGLERALEARADAWEAKADRLVREAAEMMEASSPGDSHRRSA